MDWTILLTILATAIASIGAVYAFLRNFKTDLIGHISRLEKDINVLSTKVDNDTKAQIAQMDQFSTRMDQSSARTDQLYQMFIDLLKEKRRSDP